MPESSKPNGNKASNVSFTSYNYEKKYCNQINNAVLIFMLYKIFKKMLDKFVFSFYPKYISNFHQ